LGIYQHASRTRAKKSLSCQIQATWFIIIIHDCAKISRKILSAIRSFCGTFSVMLRKVIFFLAGGK
jgi:hypothetical protein